jgi:hypothetical protein
MQRFRKFIFRIGIKAAANKLGDEAAQPVQLGLPGTDTAEEESDSEKLQQLAWLLSASNSYLTAMESAAENVYVRMDAKMGELLQWNDMFFDGMKAVARNYELVKKSLSRALEHVVIENPEDFPMMSKEKGPGGFHGATGEPIEEIITDEVVKAMTEIEPYQKKAQKWQKRALKLSIKGGNKYLTKGMKVASTKLGKSAPPGG